MATTKNAPSISRNGDLPSVEDQKVPVKKKDEQIQITAPNKKRMTLRVVGTAPLVKITKGQPTMHIGAVRNASGVADLRARPMWQPGWEAIVTIEFDADMFTPTDVVNLMARLGGQCGICEGRANSKDSCGCDWGYFTVETA